MQNMTLQLATAPAVKEFDKTTTPHMYRYRKELIKVGNYVKDSADLAFSVTRKTLEHWRDTFQQWRLNGNKVPIPLGHAAADSPEKNVGWVVGMQLDGDSLYGIMELIDPTLALTTDVSIFVPAQQVDGRGQRFVQPIVHVALCTNPVIPGLKGFEQLSLSLSQGDMKMTLKETLCKSLGVKADLSDDAIMLALEAVKQKTPVKEKKLSQGGVSDPLVKLVAENRGIKVSALVTAGLLTPAAKTAIEEQYMKPEALTLSLSGGWDDGFDFLVKVLSENKPVGLGEKTGAQLLELANTRARDETNPVTADVDRRREAAGLNKQK